MPMNKIFWDGCPFYQICTLLNGKMKMQHSHMDKQRKMPVYSFDASKNSFSYAINDITKALSQPHLLLNLIKQSFFARYQGTLLGGFWLTLTTFMMVAGLGVLYSRILGSNLSEYFPYVAIGIIVWGLISTLVNEGASVFLAASVAFNQAPIPKSTFVFRMIGVSVIALAFKCIVVVGILGYFQIAPSTKDILIALLGIGLILWTGFWFTLIFGTIGTRFRDIGQLTNAGITFAFFITPVFWMSDRLGDLSFVVTFNPLYHYINLVRGSLLGYPDTLESLYWVLATTTLITISGFTVYGLFARRISYWS
jgi:ABC-type polysaccharide/polyol phosphate export permease